MEDSVPTEMQCLAQEHSELWRRTSSAVYQSGQGATGIAETQGYSHALQGLTAWISGELDMSCNLLEETSDLLSNDGCCHEKYESWAGGKRRCAQWAQRKERRRLKDEVLGRFKQRQKKHRNILEVLHIVGESLGTENEQLKARLEKADEKLEVAVERERCRAEGYEEQLHTVEMERDDALAELLDCRVKMRRDEKGNEAQEVHEVKMRRHISRLTDRAKQERAERRRMAVELAECRRELRWTKDVDLRHCWDQVAGLSTEVKENRQSLVEQTQLHNVAVTENAANQARLISTETSLLSVQRRLAEQTWRLDLARSQRAAAHDHLARNRAKFVNERRKAERLRISLQHSRQGAVELKSAKDHMDVRYAEAQQRYSAADKTAQHYALTAERQAHELASLSQKLADQRAQVKTLSESDLSQRCLLTYARQGSDKARMEVADVAARLRACEEVAAERQVLLDRERLKTLELKKDIDDAEHRRIELKDMLTSCEVTTLSLRKDLELRKEELFQERTRCAESTRSAAGAHDELQKTKMGLGKVQNELQTQYETVKVIQDLREQARAELKTLKGELDRTKADALLEAQNRQNAEVLSTNHVEHLQETNTGLQSLLSATQEELNVLKGDIRAKEVGKQVVDVALKQRELELRRVEAQSDWHRDEAKRMGEVCDDLKIKLSHAEQREEQLRCDYDKLQATHTELEKDLQPLRSEARRAIDEKEDLVNELARTQTSPKTKLEPRQEQWEARRLQMDGQLLDCSHQTQERERSPQDSGIEMDGSDDVRDEVKTLRAGKAIVERTLLETQATLVSAQQDRDRIREERDQLRAANSFAQWQAVRPEKGSQAKKRKAELRSASSYTEKATQTGIVRLGVRSDKLRNVVATPSTGAVDARGTVNVSKALQGSRKCKKVVKYGP